MKFKLKCVIPNNENITHTDYRESGYYTHFKFYKLYKKQQISLTLQNKTVVGS